MKCQQGKISYVLLTSWFLSSFIFYHFGRFPSQAFVKCLFIQVSFSEFRAELLILSTDLYFSRSAEHVYRYFAVFFFFFHCSPCVNWFQDTLSYLGIELTIMTSPNSWTNASVDWVIDMVRETRTIYPVD